MLISKNNHSERSEKYLNIVGERRVESPTRFLYFLVIPSFIFLLFLLSSVSATTVYRSDLSDLFNNAAFNYTISNWTDSRGTSGFCGLDTNTFAETTYLRRTAGFSGISGIYECYSNQHTFNRFNFNTENSFKEFDIYINQTNSITWIPGYAGDTHTQTLVLYNNITPSCNVNGCGPVGVTTALYTHSTNTTESGVWRLHIDTANNYIYTYNQTEDLVNSFDLSGYSNWYVGWREYVHGTASNGAGLSVNSLTYNFSVYESTVPFIETAQSYNAAVAELSSQTFSDNITIDNSTYSTVSAYFVYDGETYTATVTNINAAKKILTSSLTVPAIDSPESKEFHWVVTLDGSTVQATDTYSQSVSNFEFGPCTTDLNVSFLNFTTYEEGTWTELNSSLELSLAYWLGDPDAYEILSYSQLNNNQSRYSFCFSPTYETIYVTGLVSYYYTEPITNNSWPVRHYYFDNASLTNDTTVVPLYLLTANSTTVVTFTVVDQDGLAVENAYINILRWDPGLGVFYTVEGVKTNALGTGTGSLRLYDAWYVFEVVYQGKLLLTTDPEILNTDTKTLVVDTSLPSIYTEFGDIDYTFTYNNDTQIFLFDFTDTTGKVQRGCLRVINVGNDTVVHYACVNSASGSLPYEITTNGTYIGQAIFMITSDGRTAEKIVKTIMVVLGVPERFAVIGTYGRVAAILLIGTLAMIGIAAGSIILASFLIIAGIVVSYLIGLVYFSPLVMYSIVAVIIILAVLARRRTG